jgi:hypothetical protein
VLERGGFAEWYLVPLKLSSGLHTGFKESWPPGSGHAMARYIATSFYRRF